MSGDLTLALRTAQTGLLVNQQALDVVAQNIANANTEGYSRKVVNLQHQVISREGGGGVLMTEITRHVDEGLLKTLRLEMGTEQATVTQQGYLDRLGDLFGTPEGNGSVAHRIANFQTALNGLALDPQSPLQQREVVRQGEETALGLRHLSQGIQDLRQDADRQITAAAQEITRLLAHVADLNAQVVRNDIAGHSSTDLADDRDKTLDRLSQLIDIRTYNRDRGDIVVFTSGGRTLVDGTAVKLGHLPASTIASDTTYAAGNLAGLFVGDAVAANDITHEITSGALRGLIDLRDQVLPNVQGGVDQLAITLRDQVNQVHNRGTAFPGANRLTGSRAFAEPATQQIRFAGGTDTTLVLFDSAGNEVRSTTLSALTGGGWTSVSSLVGAINGWLGGDGTAGLDAEGHVVVTTTAGKALALRDQDGTRDGWSDAQIEFDANGDGAVDRAEQGFSAFLGLNDFFVDQASDAIQQSSALDPGTRASATTLIFRDGATVSPPVAIAANATLDQVAAAINAVPGLKADVVPDGDNVRLRIANVNGKPLTITETGGGLIGDLGLVAGTVGVAASLDVRADIKAAPARLASGAVQWDAGRRPGGAHVLGIGDNTTAAQLADALAKPTAFATAGAIAGATTTLTAYAGIVIGDASSLAAANKQAGELSTNLVDSLKHKSDSFRGVNIDEEMSNMMLYQQAYSAAARVVGTLKEMFEALERSLA